MNNRTKSLAVAMVLLVASPVLLSLPAMVPAAGSLPPFLAAVASLYLGLQFYCGELSDV